MYITYGAAQFTSYKWTTNALTSTFPELSEPAKSFIAGSTSACVATTATYPFDLLRTRFAIQATPGNPKVYTSLYDAIFKIYKQEGFSGFFRGVTPAVMAMVPYMGVFFTSYEHIRQIMVYIHPPRSPSINPNISDSQENKISIDGHRESISQMAITWIQTALDNSNGAVAGLIAGAIAKTSLFPLDVVRKRLQVQGPTRQKYLSGTIPLYPRNPFLTAIMIVRTEGLLGLYKGLFVSIIKSAPASAITMWTYENTLAFMRQLKTNGFVSY